MKEFEPRFLKGALPAGPIDDKAPIVVEKEISSKRGVEAPGPHYQDFREKLSSIFEPLEQGLTNSLKGRLANPDGLKRGVFAKSKFISKWTFPDSEDPRADYSLSASFKKEEGETAEMSELYVEHQDLVFPFFMHTRFKDGKFDTVQLFADSISLSPESGRDALQNLVRGDLLESIVISLSSEPHLQVSRIGVPASIFTSYFFDEPTDTFLGLTNLSQRNIRRLRKQERSIIQTAPTLSSDECLAAIKAIVDLIPTE